ncbi:MAG: hypothetical protein IK016_00885 [Lachnospiraceae bacterium]|nr:hypothetical protein [Lachnospiraceae bacterium]
MREFRELLYGVHRSYDDFVSLVVTYVKMPGNSPKALLIKDYIEAHPYADSSDVLQYMIRELGMTDTAIVQTPVMEVL